MEVAVNIQLSELLCVACPFPRTSCMAMHLIIPLFTNIYEQIQCCSSVLVYCYAGNMSKVSPSN